jgi:hypothetical protein
MPRTITVSSTRQKFTVLDLENLLIDAKAVGATKTTQLILM